MNKTASKPALNQSGSKSAMNAVSEEERKLNLGKLNPGDSLYFVHKHEPVDAPKNNDVKPFYKANFVKLNGSKVSISLAPEELKECTVQEYKQQGFEVDIKQTLDYSKAAEEGLPDMVDIDELNSASLLFNLMNRYRKQKIYTYVGPILLALNPFGPVPGIDGPEVMAKYKEIMTVQQPLQLKKQLDPHIYTISAIAYRNLKETRTRQGIVISGESGAGKTESAKIAMDFLTKAVIGGGEEKKDPSDDIGKKILACNPILEGFGNAKTVRNNNSSRFGKYTLMYFGLREEKVYGARIKNYLLEKSRVVKVAENERGYHIFYFLCRGASEEMLSKLYLMKSKPKKERKQPLEFEYLKTGGDLWVEHDVDGFNEVVDTMKALGFSEEQQDYIWRSLAAVLLLGELGYDPGSFDDPQNPSKPGKFKNPDIAEKIAKLLGFTDPEQFSKVMLQNCMKMAKDELWTPNGIKKCQDNRDALAKQIYNNLFNWLVKRMNVTIEPPEINDSSFSDKAKTIGLLDIFGFENFAKGNNFEQLCINYVNEKLHKLYIASIFEAEKMEMREEGLFERVDQIQYPDLKVLDVIRCLDFKSGTGSYVGIKFEPEAGNGIFTTIDDQCIGAINNRVVKWEDVIDTLVKDHKNSVVFKKNQKFKFKFSISHSAETVEYEMKEFIERNVDCISLFLEETMCNKTAQQFSLIYQNKLTEDEDLTKGKVFKTIWGKFNVQMLDLMEELAEPLIKIKAPTEQPIPGKAPPVSNVEKCELHFIRCIKPRPKPEFKGDQPGLFIHLLTLQQITYMGVLESVDLKQRNFPFRKKFQDFYADYELLSPKYAAIRYYQMDKATEDFEGMSKQIMLTAMKGVDEKLYAIGRFKILMMPDARMVLERCKEQAAKERNLAAEKIKKAFCLYFQTPTLRKHSANIDCIQARYKLKHHKRKAVLAEEFRKKFEAAIIAYKAEKLKAYEQRAAMCIKDCLKKHIFRNQLRKALRSRVLVVDSIRNFLFMLKLRKFLFSDMLAKKMIKNAFNRAREKISGMAAWNVQRAFRGYLVRNQGDRLSVIKNAMTAKENLRLHVSAKKIQKRLKGQIVRRRLEHMNKVAAFIQSYFRMRWMRQVFMLIKHNTMILQRGIRRYMARRDMIKERMRRFLTQEFQVLENVREMEQYQLYSESQTGQVRVVTPYTHPKIFLFSWIADMHVITDLSEMHSMPWSSQWMKVYKENIHTETPIMNCEVGTSHSLASTGRGKQYCWGWNDNGQCARDPMRCDEVVIKGSCKVAQIQIGEEVRHPSTGELILEKAKQMIACDDRNIVLTTEGNELYAWGSNERGQLGHGHYQDLHVPTKIEFFSKQKLPVKSVAAGGYLTLACVENGNAYAWPYEKAGSKISIPVQMPFSDKVKIQRVSCGYNFGFFISTQGIVYAVGKENQDGQLGLGHRYPNDIPEIVTSFKDAGERIDSIECGFRHSIAKSTLGKLYTWGWNAHGQLGHGHFDSELSPRMLVIERGRHKDKTIQIAAGYSHSVIMTDENRTLIWFGTSGALNRQSSPVYMNLHELMPNLIPETNSMVYAVGQSVDFSVVKVTCSWSKTLSITNLMIADMRAVNTVQSHNKLASSLKILSTQWDQRDVLPPYIDVIAGLFSANVMRKPQSYKSVTSKGEKETLTKTQSLTKMSKKVGMSMTQSIYRSSATKR